MECVVRYLEAIDEINLAEKELDDIINTVAKAAQVLPARWASVSVVGAKEPFTPEVPPHAERCSISAAQWPSIERLSRALSEMHRAYDAAEAAWDQIGHDVRQRLSSPPKRFPAVAVQAMLPSYSEG